MRKRQLTLALAVCLVAAGWWWSGRERAAAITFEPHARAVLAQAGASASTAPQVAVEANDELLLLAGAGSPGSERLALSTSRDGGDSFTAPVALSAPGAAVMLRGEMGPVLRVSGNQATVLWEQSGIAGTDILVAHSLVSGEGFTPPVAVMKPPGSTFRGFANLSRPRGKLLYAVWLDGRDAHRPAGTFDVYVARSDDGGASWNAGVRAGIGSCPCCRPAVASDGHGNVYVAWRKVYAGSERDLAMSVSHDGGRHFAPPMRVADERWQLNACPESGPALAVDGNRVIAAWFSGAGRPGVRVAFSNDGGKSYRTQEVGTEIQDQNHPRLAWGANGQLWLTLQGRAQGQAGKWPPLQPFVAAVSPSGSLGAPMAAPTGAILGYPALALGRGGRLFLAAAQAQGTRRQVVLLRGRVPASQ